MFKKIIEKLRLMQLRKNSVKFNNRQRAFNFLRDKCITYVCKLDMTSETAQLPSTHKADVILQRIIKRNGDIERYNNRFPFRLVHREWEVISECYSY